MFKAKYGLVLRNRRYDIIFFFIIKSVHNYPSGLVLPPYTDDNHHRQSPRRSGPLILAKATRFFMHFVFLGLQISTAIICSAVAG